MRTNDPIGRLVSDGGNPNKFRPKGVAKGLVNHLFMSTLPLVLGLLSLAILLRPVAQRLRLPYPVLLLIMGLAIAQIPALPPLPLDPDTVFFIFLPPLLYSAAWSINKADLLQNRRAVGFLATGLVVATASGVAWLAHSLIPNFTWAEGFLLGAIVAPTDVVATDSVMETMGVPHRINTIVEGEGLINDATSLILYRFALAAVLTGQFSVGQAAGSFVWTAVASTGLGIGLGWVVGYAHRFFGRDSVSNTAITLLTPYGAYLLGEELQFSGVLVVVVCGLWVSSREADQFSSRSRLEARSVWDTLIFLLNGFVFIILGLQLPGLLARLQNYTGLTLLAYATAATGVTVAVRLVWVWPSAYVPRLLVPAIRRREPKPSWQELLVVGWAGMRGIISLAAALSLPATLADGAAFPNRDLIVLITFGVITGTLLGQGLSLAGLIRLLGVRSKTGSQHQEYQLRRTMTETALRYLDQPGTEGEEISQLQRLYQQKLDHLNRSLPANQDASVNFDFLQQKLQLQLTLLDVERRVLTDSRTADTELSNELVQRLLRELDLETSRLTSLIQPEGPATNP